METDPQSLGAVVIELEHQSWNGQGPLLRYQLTLTAPVDELDLILRCFADRPSDA
jgi:hypothetical protein